ncbi:MAG: hypothetical protein ACXWEY_05550 [Bacteroidia bacterium]
MWLKKLKILFLLMAGVYFPANAQKSVLPLAFYSQSLEIYYNTGLKQVNNIAFNEDASVRFTKLMEAAPYQELVQSLLKEKKNLHLSDWMYFLLLKKTTEEIYSGQDVNFRTMAQWFLLTKSGYRVKLLCNNQSANIFVHTKDMAFELPYIETGEGRFVNISGHFDKSAQKLAPLSDAQLLYNALGRSFDFAVTELPKILTPAVYEKTLHFTHDKQSYEIVVKGDKSVISYLRNYPKLQLDAWARVPMSKVAYNSFIPAFRKLIEGKSQQDAVRMILSFTRNAFEYETDQNVYKEDNLIFSPEMTLLSPYSDCEDRAILFAFMAKELLGLKTVLIEYPTHVSAAVNLPTSYGKPLLFGGEAYTFCEPTGPQDDLGLGELHPKFAKHKFNIISTE